MNLNDAAAAALGPFLDLPLAACVTTRGEGRYVAVTEAYADFVGLPAGALVGRVAAEFFELIHPPDRADFLARTERAGRASYRDARFRGPDGLVRHGSITVLPMPADDEPGLLLVVVDETPLWKAERGRIDADTRLELLARYGRDLVTLHDDRGTILWASPSSREALGLEPDRLEGMPFLSLVHPEDRGHAQAAISALAGPEPTDRFTVRMRSGDAPWRWIEILGSTVAAPGNDPQATFLLSSRDVTARVAAQIRAERFARSEARAHRDAESGRILLDAIIQRAPAMIAVLAGPEAVLERANAAFLAALRRGPEVVGRPLRAAFPDTSAHELVGVIASTMASGQAAQGRTTVVVAGGDGDEVRHFDYRAEPVRGGAGRTERVALHAVDVTAAVRAHEDLARSERDYRTLAAFGFEMMRAGDGETLFRIGLEGLGALIDAEFAALFDHVGDELRLRSTFGTFPPDVERAIRRPQSAGVGLLGKAVASRSLTYARDDSRDPVRDPAFDGAALAGLLAVPILHRGRVPHVMAFGASRPGWTLDEARLAVAASFGHRLEVALEAGAHLRDIEATREETFRVLGLALEYRDYETRGHTDRVVHLARRFAERLGLAEEPRQALAWGAYLHDLGKLSISDTILLKPARLTADEFAEVERHTVIGEEIARGIAFLPQASRAVIRSHHERWDGGGYPDGLCGEDIPLLARIFSIVDVFDALTSVRPYKPAWSRAAAEREVAADAGSRFEPALVDVFLALLADEDGVSRGGAGPP